MWVHQAISTRWEHGRVVYVDDTPAWTREIEITLHISQANCSVPGMRSVKRFPTIRWPLACAAGSSTLKKERPRMTVTKLIWDDMGCRGAL